MEGHPEVSGKMLSKLYSYDFADNERYMDLKKIVSSDVIKVVQKKK